MSLVTPKLATPKNKCDALKKLQKSSEKQTENQNLKGQHEV